MTYLLDSSILADLSTPSPDPKLITWLNSQPEQSLYISVVTVSEIAESMEMESSNSQKQLIKTWLNGDLLVRFSGRISEISAAVSLKWAELIARFRTIGRAMTLADSLNLAIALVYDHTLVTKDISIFEDTGVKVFSPYEK